MQTKIDAYYYKTDADRLTLIRHKVKIGQTVGWREGNTMSNPLKVYKKVKGGWEEVLQRPVYINLHVILF